MKIVVGKTAGVEFKDRPDLPAKENVEVAVRVLNMRSARRRGGNGSRQGRNRRVEPKDADPVNAKVLVLLVPDGHRLPLDLESGDYRLRLHIHSDKDKNSRAKNAATPEKGFSTRA